MPAKLIAYHRVSTKQQGRSGLGLEAQQAAVRDYAAAHGGTIIAAYTEVETGRRSDRPELLRALGQARRCRAALVVARLDRLSRNVAFLSALMEAGVEFIAVDCPHANRFMIHVLAAVAEYEAQQCSDRTKAGLAAAKARGRKLGSARPGHWTTERSAARLRGLTKARERSAVVRREKARKQLADLLPAMEQERRAGATLRSIADRLNAQGQPTSRGCRWTAALVRQTLRLLA